MGWFGTGQKDAQENKGPKNTNGMTWQEKEKYDAGYHNGKNK